MDDLLARKPLIEDFLRKGRYELSAFSFVNIFAWSDFFRFEFLEIDGCLCVFAHQEIGCFQYLPPLGDRVTADVVAKCFEHMRTVNKGSALTRIENVPGEMLELFPAEKYSYENKSPEYCYRRSELAELRGLKYRSQRWSWNHFVEHNNYRFDKFCPQDVEACGHLYDAWAEDRMRHDGDDIYQEMIRENRIVHQRVLSCAEELGLTARVVYANDLLKGYTVGYPVNPKMFCVLFEITDLTVKGLSSFIFRELCRDADVRAFDEINAMDDFAMPNVRRTKMSFKPHRLISSYIVKPRE